MKALAPLAILLLALFYVSKLLIHHSFHPHDQFFVLIDWVLRPRK